MEKETIIELDIFEKWINQKVDQYHYIITKAEIRNESRNREHKPALEVILTTSDNWVGDIIFWVSGESDMFIFDGVPNLVYPIHSIQVSSPKDFDIAFKEFLEKLTLRD